MAEHRFRCGDVVMHTLTSGNRMVAYADYETGRIAFYDALVVTAPVEGCTLVVAATDAEHAHAVRSWLKGPRAFGDIRPDMIRKLYPVDCCGR